MGALGQRTSWGITNFVRSRTAEYIYGPEPPRKFCYKCMEYGHNESEHGSCGEVIVISAGLDDLESILAGGV